MIAVTAVTGHLGHLVVDSLVEHGVAPERIVAAVRTPAKAADLAERGVVVREADYSRPETLATALAGVDVLLLISGSEVGRRVQQHANVVEAARAAGVRHLVYTSAPQATTSALVLAPEHKATEELVAASGLPATILRNGWYTENYLGAVEQARETGVVLGSVGEGLVASASRKDYAEAAAVVLAAADADPAFEGGVHELSGDVAWDHPYLAATIGEIVGREVVYQDVTPEAHLQILLDAGLDEGTAGFVVALDGNTRDGLLAATSGELSRLLGRPTTPLAEGLRAAVGVTSAA
ncbi:SDR family oxidoreductase [Oerskovia turbata]|uniref:SDR family oxidoreductase n=1 Tax=Oerskovia turbata TaxID=1713 RepID=A0A4Q1L1F0_9CELL|nr:SDR family oxidoreductase [Oerskovia turbata]RXR28111.1 SDR family oxidoreductase [Oerskovia turbata]RXR35880.1 SDR family oxidoreductase [Oerskovia turbata]TGJ94799.1 SDR family NAD(P)-dependent oxidoreductase [Actinotalea fermentans ATCC 43279 = JCM 9966 = DSM 3133]